VLRSYCVQEARSRPPARRPARSSRAPFRAQTCNFDVLYAYLTCGSESAAPCALAPAHTRARVHERTPGSGAPPSTHGQVCGRQSARLRLCQHTGAKDHWPGQNQAKSRVRENSRNATNPEANRARVKKWKEDNPEAARANDARLYLKNRDQRRVGMKNYQQANRPTIRAKARVRAKERRETDTAFVITGRMRSRLGAYTREHNVPKSGATFTLIGKSPDEFRQYLEKDGLQVRQTQCDHIFALASFDIQLPSHQARAMNWSNFQLLTQEENKDKASKLPTKAMAAKVDPACWPDGVTMDMLPDIYPGWATPLRMHA